MLINDISTVGLNDDLGLQNELIKQTILIPKLKREY